jgi:hypothetical protein
VRMPKFTAIKVADTSTWAHPVILGRQILIKDAANLTLWNIIP